MLHLLFYKLIFVLSDSLYDNNFKKEKLSTTSGFILFIPYLKSIVIFYILYIIVNPC